MWNFFLLFHIQDSMWRSSSRTKWFQTISVLSSLGGTYTFCSWCDYTTHKIVFIFKPFSSLLFLPSVTGPLVPLNKCDTVSVWKLWEEGPSKELISLQHFHSSSVRALCLISLLRHTHPTVCSGGDESSRELTVGGWVGWVAAGYAIGDFLSHAFGTLSVYEAKPHRPGGQQQRRHEGQQPADKQHRHFPLSLFD